MPLVVQPAVEADGARLAEIQYKAFGLDPNTTNIFYPNGYTPRVAEHLTNSHKERVSNPKYLIIKVVDSEDPSATALAFAWYALQGAPRNVEDPPVNPPAPGPNAPAAAPPDDNLDGDFRSDIFDDFGRTFDDIRDRLDLHDPCMYLAMICTHPDHMRRGAASLLLREGERIAERDGLDVRLVASGTGQPMYCRYGYEFVEGGDCPWSAKKWGYDVVTAHKYMQKAVAGELAKARRAQT